MVRSLSNSNCMQLAQRIFLFLLWHHIHFYSKSIAILIHTRFLIALAWWPCLCSHLGRMWAWWVRCRQEGTSCCWLKGQTWCCGTCLCTECCAGRSPADLNPSFFCRADIRRSIKQVWKWKREKTKRFASSGHLFLLFGSYDCKGATGEVEQLTTTDCTVQ